MKDEKKYAEFILEKEYDNTGYDCIKKVLRGLAELNEFYSGN